MMQRFEAIYGRQSGSIFAQNEQTRDSIVVRGHKRRLSFSNGQSRLGHVAELRCERFILEFLHIGELGTLLWI